MLAFMNIMAKLRPVVHAFFIEANGLHQKGLDVVLGQESAVLILDDTENAWTEQGDNLILVGN
ncbi:hypothetical protein CUMW_174140, partial [Citrus unshiu]